jgi:hypothetical protein
MLQGILIDTVANSARPRPIVRSHEDIKVQHPDRLLMVNWQDETLAAVTALFPYSTAEAIQDVFWRTLIANKFINQTKPPPGFFDSFTTYLEYDRQLLSCENQDEYKKESARRMTEHDIYKREMFDEAIGQVGNRVLFTTADGYAGLGPPGLKKGDRICIILGAATPFIIRENELRDRLRDEGVANGDGIFVLVGECYIHGLMGGEGMTMGEVRDIVLC